MGTKNPDGAAQKRHILASHGHAREFSAANTDILVLLDRLC